MRLMLASLAALSVLLGGSAALKAQEAPKRQRGSFFQRLDKNGDGFITLDEIPEEHRERFSKTLKRLDKNGDGKLSREELAQARGPRRGRPGRGRRDGDRPQRPGRGGPRGVNPLFRLLDANRDGKITSQEMTQFFKKLDRNGDGTITPDEMPAPRFGARPGGPARRITPEAIVQRIMRMDKNGDGKLTKDEVPERMRRFLERADANGDGALDKEELLKAFKQQRPGRRPGAGGAGPKRRPQKAD